MSPDQIKAIHVAKSRAGFNDQTYRMLLHNVAEVNSCKGLTNSQFETCMAILEETQELNGQSPGRYWRDRTSSELASPRIVYKINELFADYEANRGDAPHYELSGLVNRVSKGRAIDPPYLRPREAWNLIEQLKSMLERLSTPIPTPRDGPKPEVPF
jgi:hypothetical protein